MVTRERLRFVAVIHCEPDPVKGSQLIVAADELVYRLGRVIGAAKSTADAFVRMYGVAKEVFLGIGCTAWGRAEILAGIASSIAGLLVLAFAEARAQ